MSQPTQVAEWVDKVRACARPEFQALKWNGVEIGAFEFFWERAGRRRLVQTLVKPVKKRIVQIARETEARSCDETSHYDAVT